MHHLDSHLILMFDSFFFYCKTRAYTPVLVLKNEAIFRSIFITFHNALAPLSLSPLESKLTRCAHIG